MLKFTDGPAKGVALACSRAPIFLRVTKKQRLPDAAEWDALDQLDDKPEHFEEVHVCIKTNDRGTVHYDGRDKNGRRFGRWEQIADYKLFGEQPDDATVRDNFEWWKWCETTYAKMRAEGRHENG